MYLQGNPGPAMVKVSRPIVKEAYPRERLFKLLDRMRQSPVIWISAPAGSGKTTLVSSYVEYSRISCVWYRLNEGDADPATFFYYMGQTASIASPRKRKSFPLLTPEYLGGISVFTQRFFEQLFGMFNPQMCLVLDDYHDVPSDAPLHSIINEALTVIPEGFNVIIISRNSPPDNLIRLKTNRYMGILKWQDLRLTEEETHQILLLRGKELGSKEMADTLYGLSDGWVAGLVLMSEIVKHEHIEPQQIPIRTFDEIFSYFAQEVFNGLDPKTQDFLLNTSFLSKITSSMAQELTGNTSAQSILRALEHNNYFIMSHFSVEHAYEYHPLFRDFLRSHARSVFNQDTLLSIRYKAAQLLDKSGQTESAFSLLKENGDWESMITLVTAHAPEMVKHGRYRSLRQWLDSLPSKAIQDNPWLLYWKGMSDFPLAPRSAQLLFEDAFRLFNTRDDKIGSIMAASGVVNTIWIQFDNFTPLNYWYVVLSDLFEDLTPFSNEEIKAEAISSILMTIALREISDADIGIWEKRALEIIETPVTIAAKAHGLHFCCWYRLLGSNPGDALPFLNELSRISRLPGTLPLTFIEAWSAETQYHLYTGSHDELMKAVRKGLNASRKTGIHVEDMWFINHAIVSFLGRMDYKGFRTWLNKIPRGAGDWPNWAKTLYHLQLMLIALIDKDYHHALRLGKTALEYATKTGSRMSAAHARVLLSQTLHFLGKEDDALQELEEVRVYARQRGSGLFSAMLFMTEALFAFDREDADEGLRFLRLVFKTARESGHLLTPLDNPVVTTDLCIKALEAGIEIEYVREIVRRRGLIAEKSPVHIANWPWKVKIYALGRFGIVKDDGRLPSSRKSQQTPLRLLKALISLGGRDIAEEMITAHLWPDSEGDLAHRSFTVTLHRLRKLLGNADTLRLSDGKLTLDNRYCWVDTWAFERLLGQAEECRRQGHHETALEFVSKALDLYRGGFLAGEREESWAVSPAERLRAKFLKGTSWLGEHLEKTKAWDEAAAHYEKCLAADDCSETIYRRLMICYTNLNRISDALAVYERCRKVLNSTLGIPPGVETETFHAKLIHEVRLNNL